MIAPVDPYVAHVLASIEAAEASATHRAAEVDRWIRRGYSQETAEYFATDPDPDAPLP